jgi:hypothetical protein
MHQTPLVSRTGLTSSSNLESAIDRRHREVFSRTLAGSAIRRGQQDDGLGNVLYSDEADVVPLGDGQSDDGGHHAAHRPLPSEWNAILSKGSFNPTGATPARGTSFRQALDTLERKSVDPSFPFSFSPSRWKYPSSGYSSRRRTPSPTRDGGNVTLVASPAAAIPSAAVHAQLASTSDPNHRSPSVSGLSERRVPTFTAQSSTAELMQTIIHLREMNNKLHFSAELEKDQFEKDLEYMTDQLRVEHRREVLKLEEEVDRLRKELIGYQNTSGETLKLLSSLRQENEELSEALQTQQSKFSEAQSKLQTTVQKMEKFMDEAAARESNNSATIAKLQAELTDAQNQNLAAKQQHLTEAQKLLDGLAELRLEHAKERSADREAFQIAQSEWRVRESQLLSDLAKAEEAVATLSVCFEDALDTTEAVLRRKEGALPCPICQSRTRPMPPPQ